LSRMIHNFLDPFSTPLSSVSHILRLSTYQGHSLPLQVGFSCCRLWPRHRCNTVGRGVWHKCNTVGTGV
jgi:hypothetical protein